MGELARESNPFARFWQIQRETAWLLARVQDQSVGHHASDMLKTRPRPSSPRRPHTELSPAGNPMPSHGTAARYKHHGCRCGSCVEAKAEADRRYTAKNYEKRRASQAAYRARKRAERKAA